MDESHEHQAAPPAEDGQPEPAEGQVAPAEPAEDQPAPAEPSPEPAPEPAPAREDADDGA